jgi:hypothetical protein
MKITKAESDVLKKVRKTRDAINEVYLSEFCNALEDDSEILAGIEATVTALMDVYEKIDAKIKYEQIMAERRKSFDSENCTVSGVTGVS